MKRLSQRKAELRAAGRLAYYDGIPMDAAPVRLAARLQWQQGWREAQREVSELIERARNRARNGA